MDYDVGQELYYREEGKVLRDDVLDNNSNKEREAYRLRDREVFRDCPILAKSTEEGHEFSCDKLRGVCAGGLWYLTEKI